MRFVDSLTAFFLHAARLIVLDCVIAIISWRLLVAKRLLFYGLEAREHLPQLLASRNLHRLRNTIWCLDAGKFGLELLRFVQPITEAAVLIHDLAIRFLVGGVVWRCCVVHDTLARLLQPTILLDLAADDCLLQFQLG